LYIGLADEHFIVKGTKKPQYGIAMVYHFWTTYDKDI